MKSGSDANWLTGEAEFVVKENWAGTFRASCSVSLRTEEFEEFRDQLAGLLERLDGEANLFHSEEQVGCTMKLTRGGGDVAAFLRQHTLAELRAQELPTDQSYLQQSPRQFDALVRAFPVRGEPI